MNLKAMKPNGLAMHSNFNDLKHETMTVEEFKEQDEIEASSFDNQMRNWSYTESQLLGFAERYHQAKLKLLGIADVVGQSEQLFCDEHKPRVRYNWQKGNCLSCAKKLEAK